MTETALGPLSKDTITNVSDLVARTAPLADFLRPDYEARESPWWYRGQADESWELEPAVRRKPFSDKFIERCAASGYNVDGSKDDDHRLMAERPMNREFLRRAYSLLPAHITLVDVYLLARHHGFPTRLLDWTRNPLAALFFAVADERHREKNGLVFQMWPGYAPNYSSHSAALIQEKFGDGGLPVSQDHDSVKETVEFLFGKRGAACEPRVVLPLLPNLHAGRMLQQGACFTLHMPGAEPLKTTDDAEGEHAIVAWRIPSTNKLSLQHELRAIGVTWETLFPDLDHLALEMCAAWAIGS